MTIDLNSQSEDGSAGVFLIALLLIIIIAGIFYYNNLTVPPEPPKKQPKKQPKTSDSEPMPDRSTDAIQQQEV